MRIYGSVQICFWERSDIQQLSNQAKLLAIYLLTGPHSNMLGCGRLPDGYITEDLGWSGQDVKGIFSELAEINFLTRDEKILWVVVHDFLKWNPIQNPRQGIGIEKLFHAVPEQSLVYLPLTKGLIKYGRYLSKGFVDRLLGIAKGQETLISNPLADIEQNQNKNQDIDKDQDNFSFPSDCNSYSHETVINENDLANFSIQPEDLLKSQAIEILDFLNLKANRVYRPSDVNLNFIMDRLSSGATAMDCRQIIAKKTREWKGNPKTDIWLRPKTLFDKNNFEQYLGELVLPKEVTENGSN